MAFFAFVLLSLSDSKPAVAPKPFLLSRHVSIKLMHKNGMACRRQYSLPELELDENCCKIAQRWANYMARTGAFHHGGGEQIIAYGSDFDGVFNMWMNSAGHRFWILSKSRKCGWGYQVSSDGTPYWVGVFR